MGMLKKYGVFALGVIAVILVVRFIKPYLPATVQGFLP
jgi:hypothetical protein